MITITKRAWLHFTFRIFLTHQNAFSLCCFCQVFTMFATSDNKPCTRMVILSASTWQNTSLSPGSFKYHSGQYGSARVRYSLIKRTEKVLPDIRNQFSHASPWVLLASKCASLRAQTRLYPAIMFPFANNPLTPLVIHTITCVMQSCRLQWGLSYVTRFLFCGRSDAKEGK